MAKSLKKLATAAESSIANLKPLSASINKPPDRGAVSDIAYRNWEEGGRKNGEADSDWFRAEHQAGVPFS